MKLSKVRGAIHLARYLSLRGFDVWSLDLRGHGQSEKPKFFDSQYYAWGFEDFLKEEIPLALDYLRENALTKQIHWIGHSMGGVLLYCFLALGNSSQIKSGVIIGSSLDYSSSESGLRKIKKFKNLIRILRVIPLGITSKILSVFVGYCFNRLESFNYWPNNVERTARC